MKDKLSIWFHGTTKENYESILKNGFKPGTFFAQHLEDSIHMGGDVAFEVIFYEKPTEYWEYICSETIPPNRIRTVIDYSPNVLYHSTKADKEIRIIHISEDYDDMVKICEECDGKGKYEQYGPLAKFKDRKKITVCKKCGGHGAITIDGSDIYEHKN